MAEKVLKSNVVGSFGFVSLDIKNVILKPPLAILPTVVTHYGKNISQDNLLNAKKVDILKLV